MRWKVCVQRENHLPYCNSSEYVLQDWFTFGVSVGHCPGVLCGRSLMLKDGSCGLKCPSIPENRIGQYSVRNENLERDLAIPVCVRYAPVNPNPVPVNVHHCWWAGGCFPGRFPFVVLRTPVRRVGRKGTSSRTCRSCIADTPTAGMQVSVWSFS